jgi:hypothetical protein
MQKKKKTALSNFVLLGEIEVINVFSEMTMAKCGGLSSTSEKFEHKEFFHRNDTKIKN